MLNHIEGEYHDYSISAIWAHQFEGWERFKIWDGNMLDRVARGKSQGHESSVIIMLLLS